MSDDILDSSLGTEQPGVSAGNPFAVCIPQLGRGGTGRRCPSCCPRAVMLGLLLVEVFRELQTSAARERERSILPSLSCHTQSSSAQFYVEPNWDLEWDLKKKLKLPWRGKKLQWLVLIWINSPGQLPVLTDGARQVKCQPLLTQEQKETEK